MARNYKKELKEAYAHDKDKVIDLSKEQNFRMSRGSGN